MKKATIAALCVFWGLFFLFFSVPSPLCEELAELDVCCYRKLHINMEVSPSHYLAVERNNDHMYLWNQYMDIFRYAIGSDPWLWGHDGVNQIYNFISDDDLYILWGFHYGDAVALTASAYSSGPSGYCYTIVETDVFFNSASSWTFDREEAEDNPNLNFYDSVLLHELGHVWGLENPYEDFYYSLPTVMHKGINFTVQDSLLIHAPDAYLIRRHYQNQEPPPTIIDVGVHSKYADSEHTSWTNSTLDPPLGPQKTSYVCGDSITIKNLTVENTGNVDVGNVHIRWYLSTDRNIDTGDLLIGDWMWDMYPAEEWGVYNFTTTIPCGIANGYYYVGALVTHDGYTEFGWFDNTTHLYGGPIHVYSTIPDLLVTNITTNPISPTVGQNVSVTVTVENQGNGDAAGFSLDFYKHRDTAPDSKSGDGDFYFLNNSLASGGSFNFVGTVNYSTAGTYKMWAYVNKDLVPFELNWANNVFGPKYITVNSPGVLSVVPTDGLTSAGSQGGPFSPSSKSYTLQNTGGSSIHWLVASIGGVPVNLSAIEGDLAAGASTTVTFSINGNANSLTPGTYNDTITFTNATNGTGNTTRPVTLTVFNTSSGNNIMVSPPGSGTTITFSAVYSSGNTSVTTSSSGPALPAGFQLGTPPTYYDIRTTATYASPVTVCITYNPEQYSDPSSLRLFHYENGTWMDVTTSNDLTNYRICGQVSSLSLFVIAQKINRAPILNPIGNKTVDEGQLLEITIIATDPDGDTLTYSASNLPTGATFDSVTQKFSWTPTYDQAGSYPKVLFTVTDNGSPPLSASEEITITVGNVNRPPTLTPIGNKAVNEEQILQFTITATDPDGDGLTYGVGGLPNGALFDPAAQTFTWTPTYDQGGNYVVSFTVTDNGSPPASASETITITVSNVNRPPVLSPIGDKTVNEGQLLEFTITATDPDGDTLTYSADNLPPGADFDPATQKFSWTPGYDQAGNYQHVEFEVMDNGTPAEVAVELITITVGNVNRAPVFTPIGSQQVLENHLLQFSITANDYDGDAITYSTGTLPRGASFDPAKGLFSWRPDYTQAGTYTVVFYASDNGTPSMTGQLQVAIIVGDVPTPCELVDRIVQTVMGLHLRKSVENSYMANLKKVCQFIEEGKIVQAIIQLDVFIVKVVVDIAIRQISKEAGDNLINMAINLIKIIKS